MACKRTATTDLNHDNWNREDEPEEAGKFAAAAPEILEKRVVRTAKRRLPAVGETSTKSAFSGFSGFKTLSAPASSAFSFLSTTNSTCATPSQTTGTLSTMTSTNNGTSTTSANVISSPNNTNPAQSEISNEKKPSEKEIPEQKNGTIFKKSSDYFAKLRGLNESVTQWIRTHVESNPFCILTPIFRDYERYLKEIEAQHGQESSSTLESTEEDSSKFIKPQSIIPTSVVDTKIITASKSTLNNAPAPTIKSIFDKGNNIFGNITNKADNPFLSKSKGLESNTKKEDDTKLVTKSLTFPQTNTSTFSFGQTTNTSVTSAGFSFGSSKPFTFGASVVSQNTETKDENDEKDDDDEPPKVESKPVTETDAFYEKRCKIFIKKDGVFGDRGIGVLFLKSTPNGKTQLIVRAENSLGNLLLNTLLTESIPTKRMNEKTVMLVCLPLTDSKPPPTPVLLRVKTKEDADSLLEALENNKK